MDHRFDARSYVKPGVTLDEVEEMKETFDLFDTDGSGRVAARDLKASLQTLGLASSAIQQVTSDIDRMTDIHKVFQLFDVEGAGFIDAARLGQIAQELGERLTRQQLGDMIARADADGDGRVTLDDFYR